MHDANGNTGTATTQSKYTWPQQVAIAVMALGLLLLGVYTLWDFLSALVWAGIFAIALWPLYCAVQKRVRPGRHNILLPLVFTIGVGLIFIIPLGLVSLQLAHEARDVVGWLHNLQENGLRQPQILKNLPFGQAQVDTWWQENLADSGSARDFVERLTKDHAMNYSRAVGALVARRLTLFVFTLLTLFFLFRDGSHLMEQLRTVSVRTFGASGERVGRQIIASVHGTVDGLVLVGLGEGLLLGIFYAIAGVPNATIFGALTAIAAMIPFGAPLIFGVCSMILLVKGATAWAIALFCIGMAVVLTADHFVRPLLIGGATKLPFIWVLLGILGGVGAWGLIGLFVGPAIMAALILLWREWSDDRPVTTLQ